MKGPRVASPEDSRALSILLVAAGLAAKSVPYDLPFPSVLIFENAKLGVSIFFLISGFLITSLLLDECQQSGGISIKQFYARRAFRIWPAFYVFIVFIALLASLGVLAIRPAEIMAAALCVWNYFPWRETWMLGHTWSLAIEEQVYCVWRLANRFPAAYERRGAWIFPAWFLYVELEVVKDAPAR